jgi:hypothetical protein
VISLRNMPVGRPLVLFAAIFLPFQLHPETPRTTIDLAIQSPTTAPQATVQTASVEIDGTASSSAGLPLTVTWTVNGKFGGRTDATARWSAGYVNLAPGPNLIDVTATDGVSIPVTRQIALTFDAPPGPDPTTESLHFQVGRYQGRLVQYRVVNGRAILEGDIVLGDPETLDPHLTASQTQGVKGRVVVPESLGVALQSSLWPKVGGVAQVPYIITTDTTTGISAAISAFNATFSGVIQFVARGSQTNYVNFNFDTFSPYGVCESSVGMVGNEQSVGGSVYCTTATVMHELGHVVGLWHEQSRSDRNSYVVLNTANIDRPYQPNFDPVTFNAVDIGFYDYSSIMHYAAFGFSVNGFPTLESTPVAGIPLSNTNGYSTGDIDGVKRLYGVAPRQVTIDTNPSGLQVKVDGSTVTTPYTSSGWAIGDLHTLDLPAAVEQDGSGNWYTFGRWNNLSTTNTSQTITLVAGNGTSAQPATSPSNTYYIANYIPLWPFSAVANSRDSVGTGTVATNPNPATYSPAPGTYYLNRQQVHITATPGTDSQFYGWGDSNYPLGDNPHTFLATFAENPLYGNFVSTGMGLTTFGTSIASLYYPPASVTIDSNGLWVPLTFAAGFDTGWTAGSSHSAVAITPFSPVTTNVQYNFLKWADQTSSSPTHPPITQVATGRQAFTANYDSGSFRTIIYSSPACAGSVNGSATVNGALDEMLAGGTDQAFTAAANSPLVFAGWTGDLASFGTTAAANATIGAELLATANFNVIGTPLTIIGFSPLMAQAGTGGLTLTINGTGFAVGTQVFWNSSFRASTYVSPTQIQVGLSAADVAAAGGQTVTVQNVASVGGNNCYVFQDATYNLTAAQVHVPNVVGSTQAAATASIAAAGLLLGTVTTASSTTVPSGDVISESPLAGTLVNPGTSVNLVVSTGSVTLQSIAVTPASPSIAKGLTKQFTATGTYSDGSTQNLTSQAAWQSATPATATITGAGLATGVAVGTSAITASLDGVTSPADVLTVTAAKLKSIAATPASPSIAKGLTKQFTATGTYSDGSTKNLTGKVTWKSATLATATITSTGLATGVAVGTSGITASLNGVTSPADVLTVTAAKLESIAVTPASPSIAKGSTKQFTATGTYSDSSTKNLTSKVTWKSARLTTATITSSGLATGVAVGTSTITASLSGVTSPPDMLTVTAAN